MTPQVLVPGNPPLSVPRGARWAATIAAAAIGLLHRAPEPQPSTATLESAQARAWADKLAASDPRFAADLYAAADRHEQMAEAG